MSNYSFLVKYKLYQRDHLFFRMFLIFKQNYYAFLHNHLNVLFFFVIVIRLKFRNLKSLNNGISVIFLIP
jgi:hypothetical protein